jgi:hypothetical protein
MTTMTTNLTLPERPTTVRAPTTKTLNRREEGLPSYRSGSQRWYCRNCGEAVIAPAIPPGWYSLVRHTKGVGTPNARLGLYCSIHCVVRQTPRLDEIETTAGAAWEETAEYRQMRPTGPRPAE